LGLVLSTGLGYWVLLPADTAGSEGQPAS
jgi:hypothetical protein